MIIPIFPNNGQNSNFKLSTQVTNFERNFNFFQIIICLAVVLWVNVWIWRTYQLSANQPVTEPNFSPPTELTTNHEVRKRIYTRMSRITTQRKQALKSESRNLIRKQPTDDTEVHRTKSWTKRNQENKGKLACALNSHSQLNPTIQKILLLFNYLWILFFRMLCGRIYNKGFYRKSPSKEKVRELYHCCQIFFFSTKINPFFSER